MQSNRWGCRSLLVALLALVTLAACSDHGADGTNASASAPAGGLVAAPAPLTGLPDDEVIGRYGAAVWRVETDGCGWAGSGSAFAVDAHHLVTNHHVIATDVGPDLVAPSGDRLSGRVIGTSAATDVAVIEVDEPLAVVVPWAPTESVAIGERILAVGYPAPSLAFTVTAGEIVSFVGPGGTPEAMLTNAPINRGNSGGPALRADGSVAGVVTQMTNGGDHSAIVFPTVTVQPLVSGFIAAPQDVLSDCGYGPDYVPEVPDAFEVPAEPPPPPSTPATTPRVVPTVPRVPSQPAPASTSTTRPAPTTTAPCPAGAVRVGADQVTIEPVEGDDNLWRVVIDGRVTNGANARVLVSYAVALVEVGGQTTELYTDSDPFEVDRGSVAPFRIDETIASDERPVPQRLDLAYGWALESQSYCPAPPVSAELS